MCEDVRPAIPAISLAVGTDTLKVNDSGDASGNAAVGTASASVIESAVLTSPTPELSTVLGTSNVSFQWTAATGATLYQLNLGTSGPGASDQYAYKGTATSVVVPTLPANGVTVYARLSAYIKGAWWYNNYVYTEAGTATPATLISPTPGPGTVLGTSNVSFQWTAGTGVALYQLNLSAIAAGGSELYAYKGTATSTIAPTLPANGATVYATLNSQINGAWRQNNYVYTESGTPVPAALISPTPGIGTVLGPRNVSFQWTTGTGVELYQLNLSAIAPGDSDLYVYKGAANSTTAPILPANGAKVYATLYSQINGVWKQNDYVFTESGTPTPAALTSPTPGIATVLGTSNVSFQWTKGTGVALYQLNLSAIAPGDSELYIYRGTSTSADVPTLPAKSLKVYATLYSQVNGVWQQNSYVYAENGGPPASVAVAGTSQVRMGATASFAATVANLSNTAVTWQVNGVTGGNSTVGAINSGGIYTPPTALPTTNPVTVTAVSVASPSAQDSVQLNILNPVPELASAAAILVSGTSYTLEAEGSSFESGAQIQIGGVAQTTTFVSATELQATVTISSWTASLSMTVMNPNPGSTASNPASVTIQLASVPTAARLLDQATFGPTLSQIQDVQQTGVDAWILSQFDTADTPLANIPSPMPAVCLAANNIGVCEESEWWQTVLNGNDQLRQRVAFALSEIFVISANSVNPATITYYHNTLANDAFTNFSAIMHDVTLSPGMGTYLNMLNSAKAPAGEIANENYARELMQLFALGPVELNQDGSQQLDGSGNPIPTYTESQVEAFARAFTGWTYATAAEGSPSQQSTVANFFSPMAAVEANHDTTAKVLLNGTVLPAGQTAEEDLSDALSNVFNHPNVGPFISRQLIQHLVKSSPTPAYVSRVAAIFANNGSGVRGDMRAVIRAILEDEEARAGDTNPLDDGGRLRDPILWLTNYLRAIGFTNTDPNDSYFSLSLNINNLNQRPYRATSVFNFFSSNYVIPQTTLSAPEFGIENTTSAIQRLSLADLLVNNRIPGFTTDLTATSTLGQIAAASSANLVDTLGVMFMHGQMPTDMRAQILTSIGGLGTAQQVRVATYLIITSSQYKIMH